MADVVFVFNFGREPAFQPTGLFANPTVVVPVPSNVKAGNFPGWKLPRDAEGRALPLLLASVGQPVERVAAMGWSAGRGGVAELLKHPADRQAIDTIFDLDGLHFAKDGAGNPSAAQAEPWLAYGMSCADASHLLVLLHTKIVPSNANQITSTTQSSAFVMSQLAARLAGQSTLRQAINPGELTAGPPPPAVVLQRPAWAGGGNVTYATFPLDRLESVGNTWEVGIGLGVETDHFFALRQGQLALWRTFLAPRWNQAEIACDVGACPGSTTYVPGSGGGGTPPKPPPGGGGGQPPASSGDSSGGSSLVKSIAKGVVVGSLVSLALYAVSD